jgi:hypothetical protein
MFGRSLHGPRSSNLLSPRSAGCEKPGMERGRKDVENGVSTRKNRAFQSTDSAACEDHRPVEHSTRNAVGRARGNGDRGARVLRIVARWKNEIGEKTGRSRQGPVEKNGTVGYLAVHLITVHASMNRPSGCQMPTPRGKKMDRPDTMLLCSRQTLVLFCCPHLMPERIINGPVTKKHYC